MKISLDPSRVFVSSDFHAYHKNICKGCTEWDKGATRDFDDPVKMTEQLAKNINAKVGTHDFLIHAGDWAFGGKDKISKFRDMINCKNIIGIAGNHDQHIINDMSNRALFYKWYGEEDQDITVKFYVDGKVYYIGHYSWQVWNKSHHGTRHLYGHSHNSLIDNPNSLSFDVGVDCHNLSPLSFVEVEQIMSTKVWKPVDHHRDKSQQ